MPFVVIVPISSPSVFIGPPALDTSGSYYTFMPNIVGTTTMNQIASLLCNK